MTCLTGNPRVRIMGHLLVMWKMALTNQGGESRTSSSDKSNGLDAAFSSGEANEVPGSVVDNVAEWIGWPGC